MFLRAADTCHLAGQASTAARLARRADSSPDRSHGNKCDRPPYDAGVCWKECCANCYGVGPQIKLLSQLGPSGQPIDVREWARAWGLAPGFLPAPALAR